MGRREERGKEKKGKRKKGKERKGGEKERKDLWGRGRREGGKRKIQRRVIYRGGRKLLISSGKTQFHERRETTGKMSACLFQYSSEPLG